MHHPFSKEITDQHVRELQAAAAHARLVRTARSGQSRAGLRFAVGSALMDLGAHLQGGPRFGRSI